MNSCKSALTIALALACGVILTVKPPVIASDQKPKALHLIKKIQVRGLGFYVARAGKDADRQLENSQSREERMISLLGQQLSKAGFDIVKDQKEADAVLVVALGFSRDTPPELPRPRSYDCKLMPPTYQNFVEFYNDKGKLWATEVKMSSSSPEEESNKKAAIKITESLLKDWLKSAKKAGLNVGDKVQ